MVVRKNKENKGKKIFSKSLQQSYNREKEKRRKKERKQTSTRDFKTSKRIGGPSLVGGGASD